MHNMVYWVFIHESDLSYIFCSTYLSALLSIILHFCINHHFQVTVFHKISIITVGYCTEKVKVSDRVLNTLGCLSKRRDFLCVLTVSDSEMPTRNCPIFVRNHNLSGVVFFICMSCCYGTQRTRRLVTCWLTESKHFTACFISGRQTVLSLSSGHTTITTFLVKWRITTEHLLSARTSFIMLPMASYHYFLP